MSVISNIAVSGLLIFGTTGSASESAFFFAFLISTQSVNQVKINSTSQLISGILKILQKLFKYFNGATILTSFFVKLFYVKPPSIKFSL